MYEDYQYGYRPYSNRQIEALRELSLDVIARHPIPAQNIVGHSDIAPARKLDPGELFPWARLADWGIGLWPDDPAPDVAPQGETRSLLAEIGYPVDLADLKQVILAFQRRYSPDKLDGRADGDTRALISAVAQKVVRSVAGT